MLESQHRYLYERLDDCDVPGSVYALLATHFIAAQEVMQ